MDENIKRTIAKAVITSAPRPIKEPPQDPAEKIELILKNVEEQNDKVKSNILLNARQEMDELLAKGELASKPSPAELEASRKRLIASLETTWDSSMGDPVETQPLSIPKSSSETQKPGPVADGHSTKGKKTVENESEHPQTVAALAVRTMAALDSYDEFSRETKDYYARALERRKSVNSATTAVPNSVSRFAAGGSATSTYERSKDPRQRR